MCARACAPYAPGLGFRPGRVRAVYRQATAALGQGAVMGDVGAWLLQPLLLFVANIGVFPICGLRSLRGIDVTLCCRSAHAATAHENQIREEHMQGSSSAEHGHEALPMANSTQQDALHALALLARLRHITCDPDALRHDLCLGPHAKLSNAKLPLAANHIDVDGKPIKLSPGMNLTAEIKTGQRRVIEYLLSPIQRAGSESLRER